MPYIIIGFIVFGLAVYFFFKQKNKPVPEDANYFISTQGQSLERVKQLGLDKVSENAAHILDVNKLSFPKISQETEDPEYKPDTDQNWIINLSHLQSKPFTTDQLFKIFDKEWRVNFGAATVYGFSEREKKWTYAIVGGDPDTYSHIQVAIDLVEIYELESAAPGTKALEKYISALKKKFNAFPTKIGFDETMEKAASRGKQLADLKKEFDIDVTILLKSEKLFNGTLAWDALQSVGLVWGDGDLFHWNNEEDYGHDQHFSVWTTSEPGYFLPEHIKNGTMNPADLAFSFSVPRSADPKNVFAIMIDAVKYCQKRLGGTILDKDGNPFNEAKELAYLEELIEQMKWKGLTAGSGKALQMF